MSDSDVLDVEVVRALLDSLGGDKEFLDELMETFVTDAASLFADLRKGIAESDVETVRRASHTLKSTSASLGAMKLSGMGREFELRAGQGDLDLDPEPLEIQFEQFTRAFSNFRLEG